MPLCKSKESSKNTELAAWQGSGAAACEVPAVAALSRADGCSATLRDELYSLDEGRELFDLIHESRIPADEHESCKTM